MPTVPQRALFGVAAACLTIGTAQAQGAASCPNPIPIALTTPLTLRHRAARHPG